jgi:hypothetical protein
MHVNEYWAVERTHEDAKTIARAGDFVDEAFNFVDSLRSDIEFDEVFRSHDQKIRAGLHIFAARRLIDSGLPKDALKHFKEAWRIKASAVMEVWYKWVQATGGALGLSGMFLWYRKIRRKIEHRKQHLVVDETGIQWIK